MNQLVYEKSVSHKGYLIVPFVYALANSEVIYSYALLCEVGHKGKFHKAENPSGIFSSKIATILEIAKEHLDLHSDIFNPVDSFKNRYTYLDNLIVVYQISGKYFYDHYKPDSLNNVAAPRIFKTESDCLAWIKNGLDRSLAEESRN